ncbi:exopolysaccharide biosynthesis polyprenyl glycosylphosphotransferase [Ruminococcaceae bacterium R-25]|nr:exopolysaccharide biosynthesis polyprenyl glycosylphosphotransferase [Ruminococcaceae bacterium R-25]SUQ11388.1 exopolysaccharide biosynthesis polyprenyl glycosylphosphotransferase [Oscillospiraceae bacterium]
MGKDNNNVSANKAKANSQGGRYIYRGICAVILTALAAGSFLWVWIDFIRNVENRTHYLLGLGNITMSTVIYIMMFIIFGRFFHAFSIGVERIAKQAVSVTMALFVTDLAEVLVSATIQNNFRFIPDFAWRYLLLAIAQSVVLSVLVIIMNFLYRKIIPPLKITLIYGDHPNNIEDKLACLPHKYQVVKRVKFDDPGVDLEKVINESSSVLINDVPAQAENKIIKLCFDKDVRTYVVPKLADIILKCSDSINVIDTPLYLSRNFGMSFGQRFIKRAMDIVLSGLALIVLSPVFIITALAIKIEDHGPVFFKQERVTKNGKHFMILKFRSMIVDAEKDGRPHPAGEKDDRITKVGNIIRACRVDELPQLFNIFAGDMSIVGPRPERFEHVIKYTNDIPEFKFREKVKGGLTGYAQVYGKYNTSALDKLKLDLTYIANYSVLLDFQIIFETIKILFQKESTEGFDSERAKEMHDADCK